jgi:hypothetical protein
MRISPLNAEKSGAGLPGLLGGSGRCSETSRTRIAAPSVTPLGGSRLMNRFLLMGEGSGSASLTVVAHTLCPRMVALGPKAMSSTAGQWHQGPARSGNKGAKSRKRAKE